MLHDAKLKFSMIRLIFLLIFSVDLEEPVNENIKNVLLYKFFFLFEHINHQTDF